VANERLRDAIHSKGLTPAGLAIELNVDPKTVHRWIANGREPYPKYRHAIAARLNERERYLWPDVVSNERAAEGSESEVIKIYPHRNAVPDDLWDRLLKNSTQNIDVLVYVGMFMTEKPNLLAILRSKASGGARVRLLFGDRDSDAVIQRSMDESIGRNTISAKIDHAISYFRPLLDVDNVDVRIHGTVLYNSIYRFDSEMIVNTHVYGKVASHAPALHLRRLSSGDLFTTYAESFTCIWESAKPLGA